MSSPGKTPSVLDEILSYPANRATIPGLVDALSSRTGVVPYIGSGLTVRWVPTWRKFLRKLAAEHGLRDNPEDVLLKDIRDTAGELFLDDSLEVEFGDHAFQAPLTGAIAVLPYLTRDLAITTNLNRGLELAFDAVGRPFAKVIWKKYELSLGAPLTTGLLTLLKLHGDIYDRTERYLDRPALDDRLKPGEPLRQALDELVKQRSLLFLGIGYDSSKMLEIVAEGNPQGGKLAMHYAAVPSAEYSTELTKLLYSRRIRPIWYPDKSDALATLLVHLHSQMPVPPLPMPPGLVGAAAPPQDSVIHTSPLVVPALTLPPLTVPKELIDVCRKGECVAFAGSGLSARAGLATWRQFVEGLVDEAVRLELMSPQSADVQREALREGEANAVAENVVSAFSARRPELVDYYRRASATTEPVPRALELLKSIPLAGVLTSNYDDLLNRTYANAGFETGLMPTDSEKLLELLAARNPPFLLKLYGDPERADSLLLAPSEYQTLARGNAAFGRFMEGLFFSRTLLFLGASLEGITDYLSVFAFSTGSPRQHFALVAVTGTAWQVKAEVLQRRYNIKVLPFPVTPHFEQVDQFLESLAGATAHASRTSSSKESVPSEGPQLQKIVLRNIGPYKELELEFHNLWKILLGDNGVGKSSILRAIAVAIVGSEARHTAGRLLRVGQSLGSVTLVTRNNPSGYVTEIQRVGLGAEVISRGGRPLEAENWVALGFPPMRGSTWKTLKGPQGISTRRPTADDVMPLLTGDADNRTDDLKQWLVNTYAISRNEEADAVDRSRAQGILNTFFEIVRKVTGESPLELGEVTTDYRVMINTRDGAIPVEALSQGMTSLLGWIGILLQRLYEVYYDKAVSIDPTQQYALVLMDEIDAHMHPSWQQSLVGTLKGLFPHLQVIASTHSPLVVGGLPVNEVVRFVRDATGAVAIASIDEDMMLGRADQILTGDLFGLDTTLALDDETKSVMQEYEALLGKASRTDTEQRRYLELTRQIGSRLPSADAETKLERRAQQLAEAVLMADYRPEKMEETKQRLLALTRGVAESMGWKELL